MKTQGCVVKGNEPKRQIKTAMNDKEMEASSGGQRDKMYRKGALITLIAILGGFAIILPTRDVSSPAAGGKNKAKAAIGAMRFVPATGLLRVHSSNPRYFTDGSGKVIYLSGSHTHQNLQDRSNNFDYTAYLNFLQQHDHNFIRLWSWEDFRNTPLPYARTGPGLALDGKPKFDLTRFNQSYFDRLRSRIIAARDRGIYVAIMLFQGWSIEGKEPGREIWSKHPFHKDNNINGINGDPSGDGEGIETHTLQSPTITSVQEVYVRKVVDAVNDLDNVLYEITNEDHGSSDNTNWQYHMINFIHKYEARKQKQHPVGMTVQWPEGSNHTLFNSPAEWISPNASGGYDGDPPVATGSKVILSDTDHLWGNGGNRAWVWKSLTRGLNPIFMDVTPPLSNAFTLPQANEIRRSLGATLMYAKKINLAAMAPRGDLASSSYCLATPGVEYLVYLPAESSWRLVRWFRGFVKQTVTVDLSAASGGLEVEWFNPSTGESMPAGTTTGGGIKDFTAPFSGDAVLYLSAKSAALMR